MNTPLLATILVTLFGGLVLVIAFRLLTGGIRVTGLLSNTPESDTDLERMQAIVVALAGAGAYAFVGLQALGDNVSKIPEIPEPLLAAYGGSQLLYLIGKKLRSD